MSANSKIRSAIEKLRTMWLTSFDARHGKTDFYNYLNGVWTLYAAWKKENTRKENKRIEPAFTTLRSGRTRTRSERSSMRPQRTKIRGSRANGQGPSNSPQDIAKK